MALFDLEDVFQMAEQMEESGRHFYETVALNTPNVAVAALCRDLAQQEQVHLETFRAMRRAATGGAKPPALVPEKMQFTQGLLESRAAPLQEEARPVAAGGSVAEVLESALEMERQSIALYAEVASAVGGADAAAVAEIIREEQEHERLLREASEAL